MNSHHEREGPTDSHHPAEINQALQVRPAIVFLEGRHDIELMRRLSRVLSREQAIPCDLDSLVTAKRLILAPLGGGILADWWNCFSPLGCQEFFLLDRERQPETDQRHLLVERINTRPFCNARVTAKRSLECYLHAAAIRAAGGGEIAFGDDDSVADVLAQSWLNSTPLKSPWEELPRRTRQRFANRAKRWLCTAAVDQMTSGLLAERDPDAELIEWLRVLVDTTTKAAPCGANRDL